MLGVVSSWVKLVNSRAAFSLEMPMPESCTAKRRVCSSPSVLTLLTTMLTVPSLVNLMALATKLLKICSRRTSSVTTRAGVWGVMW